MHSFRAVIVLFLCTSCSSNIIQPPLVEVFAGGDLNLTCDHPSLSTSDYIHWYRMTPGQTPKFLISGYKHIAIDEPYKMVFAENRKSSVLLLQNIRPEQSAVYLCASIDTVIQENSQPVQ
ncbi:A25020T-cell receptor alpha chain V-J region (BDFL alpha-1) precursor - mouse [Pelobates cultripes]|nr:A25020T-cell receptor alpha chain V-J region (BDFL alpha-1) precursor - mouse [Pelobates cultripes]